MLHVVEVELSNWFRFRSVRIRLKPIAYSVESERVVEVPGGFAADPRASNWNGKSAFQEVFPFALFGWHRFKSESGQGREDKWITRGERDGGVLFRLSDGTTIERTRIRGSSTQLTVGGSHGDRAQEEICSLVGFASDDAFFDASFVPQKECASFILARPGARMATVAAWLELEKLEKAAVLVGKKATAAEKERDRLAMRLTDLRLRLRSIEEEKHFGRSISEDGLLADAEKALASLEQVEAATIEAAGRWSAWKAARDERGEKEHLEEKLAREEARLKELPEVERADPELLPTLAGKLRVAEERASSSRRLASGSFDGRCPVLRGFDCPASEELRSKRAEAREASEEAALSYEAAKRLYDDARADADRVSRAEAEKQRLNERVEILRSQLATAESSRRKRVGREPPRVEQSDVDRARADVRTAATQLALLGRSLADLAKLRAEVTKTEEELEAAEKRLSACRGARLALGRGGAQRTIAGRAVELITRGANARCARLGIDLRIGMSWQRETADLAPSCVACGKALPASRRVRECSACGAPRGNAVRDELEVELSDRSGAADDLAGLAIRRAAGAFLRRRRGSRWGVLQLDEPFGQLDELHREIIARSLACAREEDGIAQLLVAAHQPSILESLPGRILVRRRGEVCEVEVTD